MTESTLERSLLNESLRRINDTLVRIENQNKPKSSTDAVQEIRMLDPNAYKEARLAKIADTSLADIMEEHASRKYLLA